MAVSVRSRVLLTCAEVDACVASAREKTEQAFKAAEARAIAAERIASGCVAKRRPLLPLTNRGIKVPTGPIEIACRLVLEDGEVLEIPARRSVDGSAALVDWCQFTCHEDSFSIRSQGVTDHEVIQEISFLCEYLFGFGITSQRPHGQFFYERAYTLGDGYGLVCHGGQRGSVLISLTGVGCAAAKERWEERCFYFLSKAAVNGRITRIDLAHDDYTGQGIYTVDSVAEMYDRGEFDGRGRPPECEQKGNWKRPNGKGRSFYVGSRASGKVLRTYEKGMELGEKWHPWVRVEGELRNHQREIPFDVLLHPAQYLAGMYAPLASIAEVQVRIETTKRTTQITYEKASEWFKTTCGHYLWVFAEMDGSLEKLLERVGRVGKFPARLHVPDWATVGHQFHHAASA